MGLYRKLGPGPQGRCTTSTFPGPTGLLGGIKRSKRVGGWRWAAPPRAQLVPNPKPPPPVDNLTHVDGAAVGPRFPVVVVAVALRVVGVPALVHRVREASGLNVVSVSSLEGSLVTLGSGGENGLLLDSVNLLLLLVLGAVVRVVEKNERVLLSKDGLEVALLDSAREVRHAGAVNATGARHGGEADRAVRVGRLRAREHAAKHAGSLRDHATAVHVLGRHGHGAA
mmetsp:Transcript_48223/g.134899  ORF Transcript_48223/g.134899 Transcript_48223/m.134899 type:complete len:226 (+) Transcript_48223:212-889(+)